MNDSDDKPEPAQAQKFKDAARAAECDEDEDRWNAKLKKVVKQKPHKAR